MRNKLKKRKQYTNIFMSIIILNNLKRELCEFIMIVIVMLIS